MPSVRNKVDGSAEKRGADMGGYGNVPILFGSILGGLIVIAILIRVWPVNRAP